MDMNVAVHPTWDDTLQAYFTEPYWVAEEKRQAVAAGWKGCMTGYFIDLQSYASVKEWSVTIYYHLHSRSMPLTSDPTQYWPDEAMEQFGVWVNEGCREDNSQPIQQEEIIPPPKQRPLPVRVRKDIMALTQEELDTYRAKLDALDIGVVSKTAAWQQLAYIHTNWCLHYREAFLFWHRAYLLYFEEMVNFPIPYWNWTSPNAAKEGDPEAGLPQPFKDETYIHPQTGEQRPNPLRYAIAKDGHSKACELKDPYWQAQCKNAQGDCTCKYVQRDPILYTSGDEQRKQREEKYAELTLYHRQVVNALMWPVFSQAQGFPGYPWANIPEFPAPDTSYPNRCDFDGIYEQPHDNVHGWIGIDMADNAYTAFDPVFWSHHSNLDRIFENWKREHPAAMYTSNFPIRPFIGNKAHNINRGDPREYVYTNIGDLVKDCRALGYSYDAPVGDELSRTAYEEWPNYLYILFNNVRCVQDTYKIYLFINQTDPTLAQAVLSNPNYVGMIYRLGMGIEDDKGRCIKQGATRVVDVSYSANQLQLTPDSSTEINIIVFDVTQHKNVPQSEYEKLPGFIPVAQWGHAMPPDGAGTVKEGGSCCI